MRRHTTVYQVYRLPVKRQINADQPFATRKVAAVPRVKKKLSHRVLSLAERRSSGSTRIQHKAGRVWV